MHHQTDFSPGRGNALQACVASIFREKDLDTVPNFVAAPEGYAKAIASFVAARKEGLRFEKVVLRPDGSLPSSCSARPGSLILVRGTSPRGNHGHVVVGRVLPAAAAPLMGDEAVGTRVRIVGLPGLPGNTSAALNGHIVEILRFQAERNRYIVRIQQPGKKKAREIAIPFKNLESISSSRVELVHDPHPDGTFLREPLVWAGVFVPANTAVPSLSAAEKWRTELYMWASYSCWMMGGQVATIAMVQAWISHHGAGGPAWLKSTVQACTMLTTPTVSAIADSAGRRPVLLTGLSAAFLCRVVSLFIAGSDGSGALVLAELLRATYMSPTMVPMQAMIGDLHSGNPERHAQSSAFFGLIAAACGVTAPILAARLYKRDPRLPFVFASVLALSSMAVGAGGVGETLARRDRAPLELRSASPLSFTALFSGPKTSPRLAVLSLLYGLQFAVETSAGPPTFLTSLVDVSLGQQFGMDIMARARLRSFTRLASLPGYPLLGRIVRLLGARGALVASQVASMCHALTMGFASSAGPVYLSLVTMLLKPAQMNVLGSLISREAVRCGVRQGELAGMLSNLRYGALILAPFFWTAVRRRFWFVIAAVMAFSAAVTRMFVEEAGADAEEDEPAAAGSGGGSRSSRRKRQ